MISYDGLEKKLAQRGLAKSDLTKLLGISSRTIAKIAKGEKLSRLIMKKLAVFFSCAETDLCREISDNPVLQRLRDEKSAKISGGLYHELQVRMTYNSNHMEGSCLTEAQTRMIFETHTVGAGEGIPVGHAGERYHSDKAGRNREGRGGRRPERPVRSASPLHRYGRRYGRFEIF